MVKSSEKLSVGFLFDDTLDSNDGVAQYVKAVGSWLTAHGHEVHYLVGQTQIKQWHGGKVYSLSKNLRIMWGGNRLSISLWPNLGLIRKIIKEKRLDVLHVQVPYSPFMAQIVINSVGDGTAVIGTFHAFPAHRLALLGSRFLKVVYGRSFKRFDAQTSVSSAAQSYAKEAFGTESSIIPNPVNIKAFSGVSRPATDESKQIVFLGRLVKRKGARQLIEAFAVLLETLPSANLTIAGDGPLRNELEKLAEKLGISSNVHFLGFIDESDKPSLLAGADVACFPSMYGESFGIVLIEAMAAGAGVVLGGDNPGYRSVLGAQPELLVDPTDRQAFARRLHALLTNKTRQNELHEWQQKEVKKYDINVVGEQVEKVYVSAIARLNKNGHNKTHE